VFRVASGPRRGFGHVVRAQRLAAALHARAWISIEGPSPSIPLPRGVRLSREGLGVLDRVRPQLLVLDTPVASDGQRWLRAARRRGLTVVSVHDRGIAPLGSDLAVDGSLAAAAAIPGARRTVAGPRFMVVDPRVARLRAREGARMTVVVALGGGPHRELARRIGRAVRARVPGARIVIAGGFAAGGTRREAGMQWLGPRPTLAPVLASASVAVVAGGITLYEAAALRVPAVAVPIVEAQRPTVDAFARAGAVAAARAGDANGVADAVARLARNRRAAAAMAARGRRLVDGNGARRVAALIERLLQGRVA
jgi:spore coat polysaccharide biosynthesis predicted glycosyltransferase SpsG